MITLAIATRSVNLTDFNDGSNIKAIVDAMAALSEFLQLQNNIAFESSFLPTATGDNLKNRGKDWGVLFKEAIAASGIITFTSDDPATETFQISEGTQVSTQPDVFGGTIDYTLNSDVTFVSGAVSATGVITCTATGVTGNIPSGSITNMTSSIPGVGSITNAAALVSGSDEETEEAYRRRIIEYINGLKKGNEAAIKAAALSVNGVNVVRLEENSPAAGEITVYVSSQSGSFTTDQLDDVRDAVEAAAAFGIQTNIVTPTVVNVSITCTVTYDADFFDEAILSSEIKEAVYNFVSRSSETTLKISDLMVLIREIGGVTNVTNIRIAGAAEDYSLPGFNVIRLADEDTSTTITWVEAV